MEKTITKEEEIYYETIEITGTTEVEFLKKLRDFVKESKSKGQEHEFVGEVELRDGMRSQTIKIKKHIKKAKVKRFGDFILIEQQNQTDNLINIKHIICAYQTLFSRESGIKSVSIMASDRYIYRIDNFTLEEFLDVIEEQ